jgi:hypothetical protein
VGKVYCVIQCRVASEVAREMEREMITWGATLH